LILLFFSFCRGKFAAISYFMPAELLFQFRLNNFSVSAEQFFQFRLNNFFSFG